MKALRQLQLQKQLQKQRRNLSDTVLLVGLGNPGQEYEDSRHNVGFRVIEAVANVAASSSFKRMASIVDVASFTCGHRKILLAKPVTFMNLSGRAVRFLMDFFKIPLSKICVIHDDIDLPFGRVKTKIGGGNGGHNGLKSIDNLAGVDYWRIRIGVGRPAEKSMVVSYVLSKFSEDQQPRLDEICSIISDNIRDLSFDQLKQLEGLINK
ncbi:MAG: aminoacyl-tRNA hydrolase [Alphaproteobacteria bacterium]|nr:aminoacyl-tRNA hydrolase [Alphaproteobacteria bacterium]